MPQLSGKLRTALLFLRFGPTALAELIYAQILSFTEPRSRLGACGRGTYFNRRCSFASPQNVRIGDRVAIGPENRLWASPKATLTIEDEALLGPGVTIVTSNYDLADRSKAPLDQPYVESDVVIGKRCWLGSNVVVLPGVTIGEGAVIAAGAVVADSIPAWSIAGGIPAKVLKHRL